MTGRRGGRGGREYVEGEREGGREGGMEGGTEGPSVRQDRDATAVVIRRATYTHTHGTHKQAQKLWKSGVYAAIH